MDGWLILSRICYLFMVVHFQIKCLVEGGYVAKPVRAGFCPSFCNNIALEIYLSIIIPIRIGF